MGNDLEIEIRLGSASGHYEVSVDSPAGSARGVMQLDSADVLGRRRELAASVLASAVPSRSGFATLEAPVRDVGQALFEALFDGHVYGRYTASLQEAARRGEPLRIVLRLRAPELAGIPWETMFDSESGEYLCQREPVVRYVDTAQSSSPLATTGPLRILGMVAAPRDLATLDTAEERRRLDDALGELCGRGLVEMVWVEGGNWAALQGKLMAGPWHALHLIGHGGVGADGGVIALEDEHTQNSSLVSAGRFARLLHACRPVPRLVVLNACSSGESSAEDLLSSTAASLVHSGISAAVAMQFAVTDPAALAFSRGFYQALAQNIAVDEAVRLGRIAIDGTSEQTLEWVTPVLYLRTEDTHLFQLTGSDRAASTAAAEEDISQEAARYGLYVQALAALRKDRYDEAVALLDSLITLDPTYRDAVQRRDGARQAQRLASRYAEALAAEEAEDWDDAARGYQVILDADPGFRDARERHDRCQQRLDVSSLTDELRVHAEDEDWTAVLTVSADLARIDPEAADPEGLATRARAMLTPVVEKPVVEEPAAAEPSVEEPQFVETPEQEPALDATAVLPPVVEPPAAPPLTTPAVRSQAHARAPQQPVEHSGPPPDPPSGPGEGARVEDGGRRFPKVLVWAGAVAVPILLVLAVLALQNRDGTTGTTDASADAGSSGQSDTTTGTDSGTGEITCWNDTTASEVAACPLPTGLAGLTSVFPSLDPDCADGNADGGTMMRTKLELFECDAGTYTVRYSQWVDGFDHVAYIEDHSHEAKRSRWRIDGEVSGFVWAGGVDPKDSQGRTFRWQAAYRDFPYDVLVKGVDESAVEEGIATIEAKMQSEIGLP